MNDQTKPAVGTARTEPGCGCAPNRRRVLTAMAGVAGAAFVARARAATPEEMPPQVGDFLVSALGTEPLTPDRVRINAGPLEAWAMSPDGVARRAEVLNQLQLFRYEPSELAPPVQALAAGGVIALTIICPHAGCSASEWQGQRAVLACPCHGSRFSPKQGGRMVLGPARRKLPQLALGLKDGKLVVAGPFDGRVGGDENPNDDR